MIVCYALGLLCYISDFINKDRKLRQLGAGLIICVWLLCTILLALRLNEHLQLYSVTIFDSFIRYAWLFMTIASAFHLYFRKMNLLIWLVHFLSFCLLLFASFSDPYRAHEITEWSLEERWLIVHISLAMVSYAAFLVSGVFSSLYLLAYRRLKKKEWTKFWLRFSKWLPGLGTCETYAYRLVIVGTCTLFLSLTIGIASIMMMGNGNINYLFDIKVIHSLVVLLVYFLYLIQRRYIRVSKSKLAFWNICGLVFVIMNFALSNYASNFHHWIWM